MLRGLRLLRLLRMLKIIQINRYVQILEDATDINLRASAATLDPLTSHHAARPAAAPPLRLAICALTQSP